MNRSLSSNVLLPSRNDLFGNLESHFDNFWDSFFSESFNKETAAFPKLNAVEENGVFKIQMAVSGMSSDDINVEVLNSNGYRYVQISGKMSEHHKSSDNAKFYVKELRQSSWKRSLRLPENISSNDPHAITKDGMLVLSWDVNRPEYDESRKKIEILKE